MVAFSAKVHPCTERLKDQIKIAAIVVAGMMLAPIDSEAATVVFEGGGPYDIATNSVFGGVAMSAGGAGSYVIDLFSSVDPTTAVADASVTAAIANDFFTGLTMSWVNGGVLASRAATAGINTLATTFTAQNLTQQLVFSWTDSVADPGFDFDVTATAVPVPGALSLMLAGIAGLTLLGRRSRAA